MLAVIAIFVVNKYQDFNYSPDQFPFMAGKSTLFKADMAVTLIFIIGLIIVERYANRTDTKAVEQKRGEGGLTEDKAAGFFSAQDMFKRTSTARSMTVSLKTMKTTDLDLQGGAA